MRRNDLDIYTDTPRTRTGAKDTQNDEYLTWSQIFEKVDELLGEDVPRQRHHKFPWAKGEYREKTVEILQNGARRINMNWNWGE